MRKYARCGSPIESGYELQRDEGYNSAGAEPRLCDRAVHPCCEDAIVDSRRVVEHQLEILHSDPARALRATVVGASAMGRACPLVEVVTAASRFGLLVELRPGVTVADVQNWFRSHLAVGRTIALHWLRSNDESIAAQGDAEWFAVEDWNVDGLDD